MVWYILICRVSVSICIQNIHAVDCLFSVHIKDHQNVWSWLVSQASYCQLWLQSWTKDPHFHQDPVRDPRPTPSHLWIYCLHAGSEWPAEAMFRNENHWESLGHPGTIGTRAMAAMVKESKIDLFCHWVTEHHWAIAWLRFFALAFMATRGSVDALRESWQIWLSTSKHRETQVAVELRGRRPNLQTHWGWKSRNHITAL